jgi:hypothetical protein
VVCSIRGKPEEANTLCLTIGDGSSCEFFYGDERRMLKIFEPVANVTENTIFTEQGRYNRLRSPPVPPFLTPSAFHKSEKLFR